MKGGRIGDVVFNGNKQGTDNYSGRLAWRWESSRATSWSTSWKGIMRPFACIRVYGSLKGVLAREKGKGMSFGKVRDAAAKAPGVVRASGEQAKVCRHQPDCSRTNLYFRNRSQRIRAFLGRRSESFAKLAVHFV